MAYDRKVTLLHYELEQHVVAAAIAEHIYGQICAEEQRVLRELHRVQERLAQVRADKTRYGKMIGIK